MWVIRFIKSYYPQHIYANTKNIQNFLTNDSLATSRVKQLLAKCWLYLSGPVKAKELYTVEISSSHCRQVKRKRSENEIRRRSRKLSFVTVQISKRATLFWPDGTSQSTLGVVFSRENVEHEIEGMVCRE